MAQNIPKTYSILAVILIICLLAGGYMVLNNFLPGYNQAKDTLAVADANNASLKKAIADVQTFLASYKQQQPNAARVQLALPAGNPDMPNFISSMSQIAAASGVSLSDFTINSAASTTGAAAAYSIQPEDLGVSASGTYASFKDFISRIESHLRLIDIYHVSVSSGSSSTSSSAEPILDFQVKIHTYFQQ